MTSHSSPPKLQGLRLGILGAGQLAQMLSESALRLHLLPVVYAQSPSDPAVSTASSHILGELNDEQRLTDFWKCVDVVIFENEFVDIELTRKVAARFPGVKVVPSLTAIETLRDKTSQKTLIQSLNIPTADFELWTEKVPALEWLRSLRSRFSGGVVIKMGRMGYDGKGLFFLRSFEGDMSEAAKFCDEAKRRGIRLFAEALVPFQKELAMVVCRDQSGKTIAYPLVLSEQVDGICEWVLGPASLLGVPASVEKEAIRILTRIADATEMVGCLAAEFFLLGSGELVVNELAPRVHNSAHYSQDATQASQFENHVRAAVGEDLAATLPASGFGMLNLLGPEGCFWEGAGFPLPQCPPGAFLHWYGKNAIKPKRKIGHINLVAADLGALTELRAKVEKNKSAWIALARQKGQGKT